MLHNLFHSPTNSLSRGPGTEFCYACQILCGFKGTLNCVWVPWPPYPRELPLLTIFLKARQPPVTPPHHWTHLSVIPSAGIVPLDGRF